MHKTVDKGLAAPRSGENDEPCKCGCNCQTASLSGETAGVENTLVGTLGTLAAGVQLIPHGGGRPSQ